MFTNTAALLEAKEMIREHRGWFFALGVLLIILGLIAIGASTLTTMLSIMLLGYLVVIGGVILLIDTFRFWWGKWSGFFFTLLMSIFYLFVGMMLITHPGVAAISFTLLLGLFFIAVGLVRMINAFVVRYPYWGFGVFSGLVSLILGILILIHWPASGLFIIGLFIGIDLIINGWTYVVLALAAKR